MKKVKGTKNSCNVILTLSSLTFNIITTNKNNTAIAPTYIIINANPKNSTLKMNKIIAA
jgi:hypothetical protein